MRRRIFALLIVLSLCLAGLAGCQRSKPYLSVGITAGAQVFSPFFAAAEGDLAVVDLLFDNLLTTERGGQIIYSGTDGETFPYHGKSYTYYSPADIRVTRSDSDVTVQITLKSGMTFSDGEPITADDLIFTYYVLCDSAYEGYSAVGSLPITGLKDYQTQTPVSVFDKYKKAAQAIYKKGWPETVGEDLSDQTDWFWTTLRQNWEKDILQTIDYCNEKYRQFSEKYIHFPPAAVAGSEGLRTALAMVIWGYASVENGVLTTNVSERKFELNKGFYPSPTTFFEETFKKYKGDAVSYAKEESAASADILTATTEEFIRTFGALDPDSAGVDCSTISGIRRLDERSISITLDSLTEQELYTLLNVYIAPLHYYGSTEAFDLTQNRMGFTRGALDTIHEKDTAPLGSGAYTFAEYKNNTVELIANAGYRQGAPAISSLRMTEVSEIDRVKDIAGGILDITTVSGANDLLAEIPTYNIAEKFSGSTVSAAATAGDSLEYIGFNTSLLKVGSDSAASAYLRQAFDILLLSLRDSVVSETLNYRARVLTVPVSFDSAFAPFSDEEDSENSASSATSASSVSSASGTQDTTPLEEALSRLRSAGYTVSDENQVTKAPQNGTMQFYAACLADSEENPSPTATLLDRLKDQLDTIGLTLTVTRLNSAEELEAAQKGGKYHLFADTMTREESLDLNARFLKDGEKNYMRFSSDEVDTLLKKAAGSTDSVNAASLYRQAVETVTAERILVPVCQSQNAIVWKTGRFKEDTVPENMTRFWNWTDEVETLRLN